MSFRTVVYITLLTFVSFSAFAQAPVIQWQKSLGGSAFEHARRGISQTVDGGYIIVGGSRSNDGDVTGNHGNFDVWIVKLDSNGNIQWQKTLGGSNDEGSFSIQQTADSGYIVTAETISVDGDVTGNHGNNDGWIVKLGTTGGIQWQKSLGGSGSDAAVTVRQTFDGGYIVAGFTTSNDGDVTGNHGNTDAWIVKLSSSGLIQWQKALGGSDHDWSVFIEQTFDSGYIVAGINNSSDGDVTGNHGSSDAWIVKLTMSGLIQWQISLGGTNFDVGITVHQTSDSGYIVAAISQSNDGDVSGNHGGEDAWIVKLSPSGSINWRRAYGGSANDGAYDTRQTKDGGYIFAGGSSSTDGDVSGNHGDSDFWVVKLSPCYANAGSVTGPDSVCLGVPIAFVPTVPGGIWGTTNGKGSFSGSTFTATAPGIDTITYTVTDSCGKATATKIIHINPDAGTISGPDSVCAWFPTLYIASIPGGTWTVSNTKGMVDNAGNFTGTSKGIDTLFYIVTNSCGSDTAAKEIKINPLADADYIIGPVGVCIGDTIQFSTAISGGTWFITNSSAQFFDSSQKVIGVSPGRDTFFYRVENYCNADTAIKVIQVTAYPYAGTITGPSVLCVNQTITLTDTVKNGVWRNSNGNTVVSGSLTVTGVKEGRDTIWYKVGNVCADDSTLLPIVINPQPAMPYITRTGNTLAVPAGYVSYQWTRLNSPIPDATTNTITVNALANYYVVVTNSYGCSITSFPQTITEIECPPADLSIYPNPVSSTLHINWCKPVNTKLAGTSGKAIKTEHINQLNLSDLPNGIYQLSVFDEQGNKLKTQTITKLSQ